MRDRDDLSTLDRDDLISSSLRLRSQRMVDKELITGDPSTRKYRVALYSHDTMGLGHVRRNLLIAQTLVSSLHASALIIAGARESSGFPMPPGIDCLSLPSLRKNGNGQYQSRRLDITLHRLITLRAKTIRAALEGFDPDVLIVDNVPRGVMREMEPALRYLRMRARTYTVLGLRDILDEPGVVRREWHRLANEEAIHRYYDAIWVYADRAVYDPVREYGFSPQVAAKVRYTGYFDHRARLEFADGEPPAALRSLFSHPRPMALCLVGGGDDGAPLAEAFAQAALPAGWTGVILTGSLMSPELRQRIRTLAQPRADLLVVEFIEEPTVLINLADRIVAMGGYNTVGEILSFEKPTLIIPRVWPRQEQLIRAQRLQELGVLDMLHPAEMTPPALTGWLARDSGSPLRVRGLIDLNGLARLPSLMMEAHQVDHSTRVSIPR